MAEGVGEGRREEFHKGDYKGQMLGDDNFVARALELAEMKAGRPPSLNAIVREVCRETNESEENLRAPGKSSRAARARWLVGLVAMEYNSATLTHVARYFGRDVTSISNGVRQLRDRTKEDKILRQRLNRLTLQLTQIKTSKA